MNEGVEASVPEFMTWRELLQITQQFTAGNLSAGIIGYGTFGGRVAEYLRRNGIEVRLCDPQKAADEGEEEKESIMELWGNGMGGSEYAVHNPEIFLPLKQLCRDCGILIFCISGTPTHAYPLNTDCFSRMKYTPFLINFSDVPLCTENEINSAADARLISGYRTAKLAEDFNGNGDF